MLEYYRFKAVSDLFMKGREEEARLELAVLQRRYVALCDENTTFKMQVQEYEDILYLARNLVFDGDFYWLVTGSIKQGPFCPSCYNRDGLLMRLGGESSERQCPSCHEMFRANPPSHDVTAVVPHEFIEGGSVIPLLDVSQRRAKVIPFGK